MTKGMTWLRAMACVLGCVSGWGLAAGAQDLQVAYNDRGVQRLVYRGVVLEDQAAYPGDAFHIWHMKSTGLDGRVNSAGEYGWGEAKREQHWDANSRTMTYVFGWGSIAVRFEQRGDTLNMVVTETNRGDSGILFDGAEVFPLALHFPQEPRNFFGYSQYAITSTGPSVSAADFGAGVVTSVVPDAAVTLYSGWKANGNAVYSPVMTSTAPDSLPSFLPHNDVPLAPGTSLSYTVSLRFTPEGTEADASDSYSSYAAVYPNRLNWTDRRILGTAYLASAPGGDSARPGGYPGNPRRYFNDASLNLYTAEGVLAFQQHMLRQAAENVATAARLDAQGVITWDLEGEEYPHSTSYVGSPDQIATLAPEMEAPVLVPGSRYFGQRLDDAYFRTMTDAGLRVGVCIRPQVFTRRGDGSAEQVFLNDNDAVLANLERKARYSNARWGVTLFYVDSDVNQAGGALDPAIFERLHADMPGVLFVPEWSTPRYYAYSAPLYSFLFHGDLGTPDAVYKAYPQAFGANLINDVSPDKLAAARDALTRSVARGDLLMGHADYWQDNDPTLVSIYAAAGHTSAAPPVQVTPVVSWAAPSSITFGTALSGQQLNATGNVEGSFTYSPAAGTVPAAGVTNLTATFTPRDTSAYASVTVSRSLTVDRATPALHWNSPSAIVQGSPLGAQQLNASADVAGSFTYTPGAGATLPAGTTQLRADFVPADGGDYAGSSVTVDLQVNAAEAKAPRIDWATPPSIVAGTPLSGAQLNAASNVAGTFTYLPAAGTLLPAGSHTLVAVFSPADPAAYTTQTSSVGLTVQAAPAVQDKVAVVSPGAGQQVAGIITVLGRIDVPLDAAGSFLIVDGVHYDAHRVTGGPYLYELDTTRLQNGPHALQIWAHDIGNNTTVSSPVQVLVSN